MIQVEKGSSGLIANVEKYSATYENLAWTFTWIEDNEDTAKNLFCRQK